MSAVPKDPVREAGRVDARFAKMSASDLDDVIGIERDVYTHPWTRGNFVDSLNAGYHCRTYRIDGELAGYFIIIVAVGEAHLLNLSVAAARHRQGVGSTLLREAMRISKEYGARHLFLEVRPSNTAGLALYGRFGFKRIAERKGYYPAHGGRENALVLTIDL